MNLFPVEAMVNGEEDIIVKNSNGRIIFDYDNFPYPAQGNDFNGRPKPNKCVGNDGVVYLCIFYHGGSLMMVSDI